MHYFPFADRDSKHLDTILAAPGSSAMSGSALLLFFVWLTKVVNCLGRGRRSLGGLRKINVGNLPPFDFTVFSYQGACL